MFAKSLETIPRTIADNAGLDSLDIINRLRSIHRKIESIQIMKQTTNNRCTLESISTMESETTSLPLFGNPCWSRSMPLRLPLRLLAPFFPLMRQLETPNLIKKSNNVASRKPSPRQEEDDMSAIYSMLLIIIGE